MGAQGPQERAGSIFTTVGVGLDGLTDDMRVLTEGEPEPGGTEGVTHNRLKGTERPPPGHPDPGDPDPSHVDPTPWTPDSRPPDTRRPETLYALDPETP